MLTNCLVGTNLFVHEFQISAIQKGGVEDGDIPLTNYLFRGSLSF